MGQIVSVFSEFMIDLRAQKLRVFLTVFGITWGTVAIIVLVSFGMGFKTQTSISMHGIGESVAIMFPGRTTKPFEGFGTGRGISFVEDDARLLASQVGEIKAISPEFTRGDVPVRVGENILQPAITGVYPVYSVMRNIIPGMGGRFLDDQDMQERRRVVILGDKVKDFLFGETDPIGKLIYVGQVPFTVIGVMLKKTQNSSYNSRDQDRIFIPASTFSAVFGVIHLSDIIYQPVDPSRSDEVNQQVRAVLGKHYRFDPTDEDAVWIWDTTEFDKFLLYFFLAFDLFMGLIGSFTLAVGGIGVANIMYIVVQERTKEIGIKRAVGAKKSNILFQFFMETFFIIGIGSVLGFGIGLGIIEIMQFVPIKEYVGTPEFSFQVAAIVISVLSVIGFIAGIMPARRAANLSVVDCLRV
jgi:putative ABC transport system permease protein